jgi:hypothetical protein
MYNPLRRVITKYGEEDPLLLAHHPTCEYYSHHVVEIYGQKVCMGCFIVYPIGFLSLASLVLSRSTFLDAEIGTIPTLSFYVLGFALISPKVVAKVAPGRRAKNTRILTKAVLAVGLAFVAFPFFFRPAERVVTVALFLGFLIPYVAYKGLTATDDCEGCPEVDEFPNCSGLSFDGTYRYAGNDSATGDQER